VSGSVQQTHWDTEGPSKQKSLLMLEGHKALFHFVTILAQFDYYQQKKQYKVSSISI